MDINDESKQLLQFFRNRFGEMLNFSLEDYLHAFGRGSNALLCYVLFFPETIKIEDSIFLKKMVVDEKELEKDLINSKKPVSAIEMNYNFIEVGYIFDCNGRDISDEEDLLLAKKIKLAWSAWLKYQYPCRNFVVKILTPKQTGSTVGVQFYELRSHK